MTTALLGITCWLGLTAGEPAVSPTEFQSWFRAASHGRLHLPREAQRGAQTYRYVFISGLANEYMPGYFAQSAKEVLLLNQADAQIRHVYMDVPHSAKPKLSW